MQTKLKRNIYLEKGEGGRELERDIERERIARETEVQRPVCYFRHQRKEIRKEWSLSLKETFCTCMPTKQ